MLSFVVTGFAGAAMTIALIARVQSIPAAATRWRQTLIHALTDPYRPELHYMRGPGPRWRRKHAASAGR